MTKQEIIDSLEICISMSKVSENTLLVRKLEQIEMAFFYQCHFSLLVRKLEQIEMALIKEWNESDAYYQQIKQSINE